MKLLYVPDPMLDDTMRPATRKELLDMQKKHWEGSTRWTESTCQKYFEERLKIRHALANHTNNIQPHWVQRNQGFS